MGQGVSDWVNGLLDDFWNIYYPNIPRKGNASESKCKAIEDKIDHHISCSSLSNYFKGRGSLPSDSTKNIIAFFILKHWQQKFPHLHIDLEEEKATAALTRNDRPNTFLLTYHQLKGEMKDQPGLFSKTVYYSKDQPALKHSFFLFPKGKYSFFTRSLVINLVVILAVLSYFIVGRAGVMPSSNPSLGENSAYKQSLTVISFLHVATIALLVLLFYTILESKKAYLRVKNLDVRQAILFFQRGWLGIYFSWILLYAWMSFKWSHENQLALEGSTKLSCFSASAWAIADVLSLMSTFLFFYLFNLLDVQKAAGEMSDVYQKISKSLAKLGYLLGGIVCFSIIDRFYDLGAFENTGVLIYSLLTALSGLYLFGRLDSHHFNTNRLILAPLYIYALLQMIWSSVNSDASHYISISLFFLAFLLKIYFFFLIIKWLRNGDLERYFTHLYR